MELRPMSHDSGQFDTLELQVAGTRSEGSVRRLRARCMPKADRKLYPPRRIAPNSPRHPALVMLGSVAAIVLAFFLWAHIHTPLAGVIALVLVASGAYGLWRLR